MITPEEWSQQRNILLNTGREVHNHFNIGRIVTSLEGRYPVLDYVVNTPDQSRVPGKRLLCFPTELNAEVLPRHPSVTPFIQLSEGNLINRGVSVLEVPSGTVPLLRVAQGFDTIKSGAPTRSQIFNDAGKYVAGLWRISKSRLPENLGIRMLCYINEDNGAVAYVPPNHYVAEKDPMSRFKAIEKQIVSSGLAQDVGELAAQFNAGVVEVLDSRG